MTDAAVRSRRRIWTIAVLVLAAVALAAGLAWRAREGGEAPLRSAAVERGDIELSVSALGRIGPKSFVDVGAQVSGQLEKVHVQVGDRVEAGQLLAEIDPQLLQSRVEGDRARVASLQAQAAERAAGVELAQAQAQQRSLQAQLREAQSTLAGNEASLGYARILAPIAGTVVSQAVLEGQTINANQVAPTLLRIADLQTMTVTAQVAEADIVRLRAGMPAYFTTLGLPQRRWQGTVRQLLPTPDILNEVVLYRVLIDVDNADGALLPDMTAQVFFELESARDTLLVPLEAVARGRGGEGSFVRVLGPRGALEQRAVRLGLRDREQAQVLEGLREGERVLLPGVREGQDGERRPGFGLLGGGRRR